MTIVKTPALAEQLRNLGAGDNVKVIPVGLDESILKQDYAKYNISSLKENGDIIQKIKCCCLLDE